MFTTAVNMPCINNLFSTRKIRHMTSDTMHPVTKRIYEAVQLLTKSKALPPPARVASEANISLQTLTNWHARGPSAQGLLDFQLAHGFNATWLLTGHGPQLIGTAGVVEVAAPAGSFERWPLSAELLATLSRLEPNERRRIENGLRGQLDMTLLPADQDVKGRHRNAPSAAPPAADDAPRKRHA